MGPMDKEGKKSWVLCSAARAVENEIARASKQVRPGESLWGSLLDLVEPSLTRTRARISLALYHAERASTQDSAADTSPKFGYKSSRVISVSRLRDRLPAQFRVVCHFAT